MGSSTPSASFPPASASQANWAQWLAGARPHTWANAFAPVLAGTAAAAADAAGAHPGRALLAALVSWALIVGVNFANDYSDGIRGTDGADRTGPTRLTGSGVVPPQHVKLAAFAAFALAAFFGIWLSLAAGAWWFILLGAGCIAAAWFYTGGSRPYGYRGFGEAAVFVFFGLVAVLGTEFTQSGTISWIGLGLAVGIGAMSAGVNLVNNIRDIPSDAAAGKITLAVRLGDRRARDLFTVLALLPALITLGLATASWPVLIALCYLPAALNAVRTVNGGAAGPALIPVLGTTGRAMLSWAAAVALGLTLF